MDSSLSPLELRLAKSLHNRKRESRLRTLKAFPSDSVDFSSNDFLSLSTSLAFRQAYLHELDKNSFKLGSTGSRLLDGNSSHAEALEKSLASFHGGQAGLLTNSGFDANVSLFSCLPQPGDIVIYDELIHASVHDGMRQSRAARCIPFRHNCVQDLELHLRNYVSSSQTQAQNIFIAVESVYSMDGDLAPLPEIVDLIAALFSSHNKPHIIVDEAHATGIYGPSGRGLVSAFGLEKHIFARLHTFGKALGCNGAIIICSEITKLYLINYARPLIYTTFMSFPQLNGVKVAYDFLQSGKMVQPTAQLFKLINSLHKLLRNLPPSPLLTIPCECPKSPIFAILSSKPKELASYCQAAGFVVRAVVPPTVPEGTDRVRVCLHAGNTEAQISRFVDVVRTWLEQTDKVEQGTCQMQEQQVQDQMRASKL